MEIRRIRRCPAREHPSVRTRIHEDLQFGIRTGRLKQFYGANSGNVAFLRGLLFSRAFDSWGFLQRQFQKRYGLGHPNEGQLKQHLLIQDPMTPFPPHPRPKNHNLLEKTVILINSEFGRPGGFDSGGGRGHQSKCFTNASQEAD